MLFCKLQWAGLPSLNVLAQPMFLMDNKPNLGPTHDYWPSIYEHDFLEIQSLENIFQETRLIQVLAKLSFQVQKYDVIIHRT